MIEAHAGSLLWLIKAELCFLSRAQSVNGFKRENLSFHFHSGVMDRTSRMQRRIKGLVKAQSPWALLRETAGFGGLGGPRFPQ